MTKYFHPEFPRWHFAIAALILAALMVSSCGGAGGGGSSPVPPTPADFTLSVQPASVTVQQGSSGSVMVSISGINGFSAQASVSVNGTPSGISAAPSQFTLTSGGQQAVSIQAAGAAATGNVSLTVTATSGSLVHSSQIALAVSGPSDFALSIQPTSVSLATGSSTPVTVGLTGSNGFASQASVAISGMPAGVSATPSEFYLSSGEQQTVTLSADSTAVLSTATLTVAASSGSLDHAGQIALAVTYPQTSVYSPSRTRYIRTDALWDPNFVLNTPQQWILYESVTRRFFVANTELNRVDVIDAATELKIGEMTVPGAWSGDISPDHKTIYLGTQIGDIYEIDPVAMTVTQRIPALQIGPSGYQAFEVRVMANGNLALLGGQGGIAYVDGYANVAVWNPADNSLEVFASAYGMGESGALNVSQPAVCGLMGNIGQFALTADRTKILLGSIDSDGTLCLIDPSTHNSIIAQGSGEAPILVTPDGQAILSGRGSSITVFDGSGLYQTDQFQVGSDALYRFWLSVDGGTLFAAGWPSGKILAYDWKSHQLKGWVQDFLFNDFESSVVPQVADETGLMAGVLGHGVGFVDGGALQPTSPVPAPSYGEVQPATGPMAGGTAVKVTAATTANIGTLYFGNLPALTPAGSSGGVSATTPPGPPGTVDVALTTSDGNLTLVPEGFSYGPTILEVVPNASTAEGGGYGFAYGYGFGPVGLNTLPSGLSVSVGGRQALITNYAGGAPYNPYPFPIQFVEFTVPAGTAGTFADVTVNSASGSATAKGAIQYLAATQRYSLPGSSLYQGIYDSKRDVYYFSDQAMIRVFSRTQAKWLAPIAITGATRLYGIALSPSGNLLAVGDPQTDLIYVLNPDVPATVSSFPLPNTAFDSGAVPCGVAITDYGVVYYANYDINGTGDYALHKLNTATGTVTDYQNFNNGQAADAYIKVLLSSDNKRLFVTIAGYVSVVNTATDTTFSNPIVAEGDYELTLSSNQTWMSGAEYVMDTNLNPESHLELNEREVWNQEAVYGEKMSADGRLLFAPLINSIDVYAGRTGEFRTRIALPFNLSANYDALVSDGNDNVLVAITGQTGDGIAVIDLTSLPEPLPLPYSSVTGNNLSRINHRTPPTTGKRSPVPTAKDGILYPVNHARRIPHRMNPLNLSIRAR